MRFYERAYLSITRQKSKTLILFLVLFLVGNVIAGATAIKDTSDHLIEDVKEKLGTNAAILPRETNTHAKFRIISHNDSGVLDFNLNFLEIPEEVLDEIKNHPSIEVVDIGKLFEMIYYNGTNRNLIAFTSSTDVVLGGVYTNYMYARSVISPNFYDLETKTIKLVEGRNFTQEDFESGANVTLINEHLSKLSKINVGDKIPFRFQDGNVQIHDSAYYVGESYELEVIGVFELNTDDYYDSEGRIKDAFFYMYVTDPYMNELRRMEQGFKDEYPDYYFFSGSFNDGLFANTYPSVYYPTFILKSSDDLDGFKADVEALIDADLFKVVTSNDAFESISAPLSIISLIAQFVLVLGMFVAVLITGLISLMFIRDRIHELGIYSAIGKSRLSTVLQVVSEIMSIALLAASLSLISGYFVSNKLADAIVENQLRAVDEAKLIKIDQTSNALVSAHSIAQSYQIDFDERYIVQVYSIIIGASVVSSLFPLMIVLTIKPRQILL